MNEAPDAEREPSPYLRLPWPAVAAGLLAFVALVLAAGLFANRNLRPQLGVVPTPSAAALTTTTPIPVVAPPTFQANTPTSVPTPVALLRIASDTATPAISPTSLAPTATSVAVATATPAELPTVEPALADEIGKAYVAFWRVKSQALLELDPMNLSDVMDGDYLATTTQLIEELRSEGRAIKTQVSLNYLVVEASAESATVVDNFEDNSIYVAIGTEDPLSTPMLDRLSVLYRLRNLAGAWKVVDSARHQ